MSGSLPLLLTSAGAQPTPVTTINTTLINNATALAPGLTTDLPASMVEDLISTGTAGLSMADQARVDAVNNVSPLTANPFILAQLGQMFGLPQGQTTNGSVFLVFSGTAGYFIPAGFVVSDGTNEYIVQTGGTIATGGTSQPIYAVATNSNIFVILANTVTVIVTSVPTGYTLTVTNPTAGTSALAPETVQAYRARVLNAYAVAVTGTPTYLKTLLTAIPGVSPRLVSVRQVNMAYEIICGGGDPYQVAGAIYSGTGHISMLAGSTTTSRNITVSIYDAPDTYSIIYVNPPQQVVTVAVTWNTTLTNFTASTQVNQYIVLATQSYINGIYVGQPINLMVLTELIQQAVASVLSSVNLTTLTFAVTINGVAATPSAGTSIIVGDPESYFYASATDVTSVQG